MYKKFVRTVIVLGVLAFIAYKAYEYFVKKNQDEEIVDDFDDNDELNLNQAQEETLVDKIKAAAQKVLG